MSTDTERRAGPSAIAQPLVFVYWSRGCYAWGNMRNCLAMIFEICALHNFKKLFICSFAVCVCLLSVRMCLAAYAIVIQWNKDFILSSSRSCQRGVEGGGRENDRVVIGNKQHTAGGRMLKPAVPWQRRSWGVCQLCLNIAGTDWFRRRLIRYGWSIHLLVDSDDHYQLSLAHISLVWSDESGWDVRNITLFSLKITDGSCQIDVSFFCLLKNHFLTFTQIQREISSGEPIWKRAPNRFENSDVLLFTLMCPMHAINSVIYHFL